MRLAATAARPRFAATWDGARRMPLRSAGKDLSKPCRASVSCIITRDCCAPYLGSLWGSKRFSANTIGSNTLSLAGCTEPFICNLFCFSSSRACGAFWATPAMRRRSRLWSLCLCSAARAFPEITAVLAKNSLSGMFHFSRRTSFSSAWCCSATCRPGRSRVNRTSIPRTCCWMIFAAKWHCRSHLLCTAPCQTRWAISVAARSFAARAFHLQAR
mmetsp:Transcript_37705/g.108674  ORF Transcript_37705/g.108674 Transcript_37705/m.108674 type:complete len:215 (-) Transcript_37705:598-1242(-)